MPSEKLHDIRLEGILCDEGTGTGVLTQDGTAVENCLLCGLDSLNGYKMSKGAFGTTNDNKVQKLYEGKLVFIDHPEQGKHPMQRKVQEFAGKITNVRFDAEGRPRGDIETAYAPQGGLLRDLIKGNFKNLGLSHTAQYRFNKDKTVVESIENVFSVDVVVNPATTKTFREDVDTHKDSYSVTLEEAMSQLFEAKAALTAEGEKATAAEQRAIDAENRLATVKTELETVKVEMGTLKTEKVAREQRDSLLLQLKEKGINTADSDICPENFIKALLVTDGEVRESLIADKVAAIEAGKNVTKVEGVVKERKEDIKTEGFDVNKALAAEDIFV